MSVEEIHGCLQHRTEHGIVKNTVTLHNRPEEIPNTEDVKDQREQHHTAEYAEVESAAVTAVALVVV